MNEIDKEKDLMISAWIFVGGIVFMFLLVAWIWVSVSNGGIWYKYGDIILFIIICVGFGFTVLIAIFITINYFQHKKENGEK